MMYYWDLIKMVLQMPSESDTRPTLHPTHIEQVIEYLEYMRDYQGKQLVDTSDVITELRRLIV